MVDRFIRDLQSSLITQVAVAITFAVLGVGLVYAMLQPRLFLIMAKNLKRNKVRTGLTVLATVLLVFMIIMIWTILSFIEGTMEDKAQDFKIIITERWQVPSRLPPDYARRLSPVALNPDLSYQTDAAGNYRDNPDFIFTAVVDGRPLYPDLKDKFKAMDFMSWCFYGGSTEKDMKRMKRENFAFFFAMQADQIKPMLDEMENFPDELVAKLKGKINGCLLGPERLAAMNLRVGDTFKIYSINYKDIDLEFEIVGTLPDGRYATLGIMNFHYFRNKLDEYAKTRKEPHPLADRCINLIWMRVRDKETFARVQQIVEEESPLLKTPSVKCETGGAGISSFLDPWRDIFWGVKYILVPAVLISMALIIANAISINVRERRAEMAVLKVLGYRPEQVLVLVLGESLLVGALSGLVAALLAFVGFNLAGGIKFPVAFFPAFPVPLAALFWGPAMGALTALLGSFSPSWSARSVKVSEVFAKVA